MTQDISGDKTWEIVLPIPIYGFPIVIHTYQYIYLCVYLCM